MKKIILIIFFCCMALNAGAEVFSNCIPFYGANGKWYCYMNGIRANAVRAITWCDAQGLRLVSLNSLCDVSNDPVDRFHRGNGGCKNLVGVEGLPEDDLWTRSGNGEYFSCIKPDTASLGNCGYNWLRVPVCEQVD